jgi:ribonuclease BN (tRNA processing enzyme)
VEHTERPAEALVELARGADVLVHDAMYTADEYLDRKGLGAQHLGRRLATRRRRGK